jgi:ketose-bisphosphate aldolase
MAILTTNILLENMPIQQKALPHFDVGGGNIDIIHGICKSLKDMNRSAIMASTPASVKDYYGYDHFVKSITNIANIYDVDVAIHLDHAQSIEEIKQAIKAGYTSVMYDGSALPLKQNIINTQKVKNYAKNFGVSVEGEIGIISGKEDEIVHNTSKYPTFTEAKYFLEETEVDFFAPAVGTAHGFYDTEPDIQWNLVTELKQLKANFVLHGVTGISSNDINKFIELGYKKFNFATGLRSAFRKGILSSIESKGPSTKPQDYLGIGRKYVYEFSNEILKNFSFNEK